MLGTPGSTYRPDQWHAIASFPPKNLQVCDWHAGVVSRTYTPNSKRDYLVWETVWSVLNEKTNKATEKENH